MKTVTLEEAQKHLSELVQGLSRAGEMTILKAGQPVARLSSIGTGTSLRDIKPHSVGAVLRPYPSPDDDVLSEMLHSGE